MNVINLNGILDSSVRNSMRTNNQIRSVHNKKKYV